MNTTVEAGISILLGVLVLAGIALIVSQNANTSNVVSTGLSGVANLVSVAISPVSGSSTGAYNTSASTPF